METRFFKISLIIAIFFVSCFVIGCQTEEDISTVDSNEIIDGYLSLPEGFNLLDLSDRESHIFMTAFSRMSIASENGIFKTKFTSGNQVNISEELFNFFRETIINSNKSKDIEEIELLSPRLKLPTESTSNNDCVAYSIYNAIHAYGSSTTLASVKSYIQNTYGTNGVLLSSITGAIQHYLTGSPIALSDTAYYSYLPSSANKIIIVIPGSPYHAVNLYACSNGLAVYTDSSSGTTGVSMIERSKVVYAFKATGAK
ncbi:MAG: hypothetical protein LBK58_16415 [Prevotellaceae bacterium]|jgi:hypothetical protein|nr:hypothetical protein [Prevotellaceae bacterium]